MARPRHRILVSDFGLISAIVFVNMSCLSNLSHVTSVQPDFSKRLQRLAGLLANVSISEPEQIWYAY